MHEVREKPKSVERAYLLATVFSEKSRVETELLLEELEELLQNLGIEVVGRRVARIRGLSPKFILGKGKVEEVIREAKDRKADVIVFDNEISPGQQRNWEESSGLAVIDRHEVILDVFAERARTKEAKLQVKLARLEYSLPRLRRAWTHLSRQRGGGVTQRGEGEAQIELDQRMLREQIASTKKEIKQVSKLRQTGRALRERIPLPSLALVGYTNAGKSTLLNAMTGSSVLAEDKLFATLDPTSRRFCLPGGRPVVATDTVGFIRKLPHRLVDAFKATLEEALVADLLLHVVDLSHPEFEKHMETTLEVLRELGAQDKEILTVYNKIDRPLAEFSRIKAMAESSFCAFVSARNSIGMAELSLQIEAFLSGKEKHCEYLIPLNRYDLVARLRGQGGLQSEDAAEAGYFVCGSPRGALARDLSDFQIAD